MKKTLSAFRTSLQGKLALWYVGSIITIVSLLLLSTSILFWFTLQSQIDHHVHIVVTEAAQIVQQFQNEQRQELLKNLVSAKGMTIVLLSPDGSPILETNSPDVAVVTEHQLQGILSSSNVNDSVPSHFTESGIRFAAVPVQINAGKGILAVGYSTQILTSTFTNILFIVGLIIVFCIVPLTYLGYRLLRKQLAPLQSIAQQAQKINTSTSLSRRIELAQPTEELATIQKTLNHMLAQLEDVFIRERIFFSDAAHTLKTPLAVLHAQIENLPISLRQKTELQNVIESTNETIQDLLFLSKVDSHNQELTTFSLSELVSELVEITSTLAEQKNITVHAKIEKNISIRGNRPLFLRAISNIAHNAVIYNRQAGSITIEMSQSPNGILLTLADTGIGVTAQDKDKIFSRFFRGTQAKAAGSGLGLSISQAVIESMGGTIHFESRVGKGSTVTITLP